MCVQQKRISIATTNKVVSQILVCHGRTQCKSGLLARRRAWSACEVGHDLAPRQPCDADGLLSGPQALPLLELGPGLDWRLSDWRAVGLRGGFQDFLLRMGGQATLVA